MSLERFLYSVWGWLEMGAWGFARVSSLRNKKIVDFYSKTLTPLELNSTPVNDCEAVRFPTCSVGEREATSPAAEQK